MASSKALKSLDLYTVGWIAALPLECAAATAMLDEIHRKPLNFEQPHTNTNSYTWGRIGKHNLVIASLAAGVYDMTSAAITASCMLSSFPQIRVSLLVGIGASIARSGEGHNIQLGDIAVSQSHENSEDVIQYDLFKVKLGNHSLKVLLHALVNLQTQHLLKPPRLLEYLKEVIIHYPRLAKQRYVHQGFESDQLFKTTDPNEEIQHERCDSIEPEIHYNIIASDNTLFKDAAYRDKILENIEKECICFEMKAAGLMNNFPCIVVREICDYTDSHKND
ncbi:hypothetical protein AJ79_00264 [Helicocarpus griseus UAMH5409]|uniref:Nucleoside phosphorylase domain-containing protein n=1 Tax=Helicocarpus griseus UAMH5409 TaxID=1447875 RepID=A0A2B7YCR2_9EURO|nr:hypothetical protein AJ79_00264 [Helicocarpus griseus UAMH5409]